MAQSLARDAMSPGFERNPEMLDTALYAIDSATLDAQNLLNNLGEYQWPPPPVPAFPVPHRTPKAPPSQPVYQFGIGTNMPSHYGQPTVLPHRQSARPEGAAQTAPLLQQSSSQRINSRLSGNTVQESFKLPGHGTGPAIVETPPEMEGKREVPSGKPFYVMKLAKDDDPGNGSSGPSSSSSSYSFDTSYNLLRLECMCG